MKEALRLEEPQAIDGLPLRVHLDRASEQLGRPTYTPPEPPPELAHVWGWFLELSAAETLTYGEIEAWARLTGRRLRVIEVRALVEMAAARTEFVHERSSKARH